MILGSVVARENVLWKETVKVTDDKDVKSGRQAVVASVFGA